jgi:hypothetical protein
VKARPPGKPDAGKPATPESAAKPAAPAGTATRPEAKPKPAPAPKAKEPAPATPKVERKPEKPAPAAPKVERKVEKPAPAAPQVERKVEKPAPAAPKVERKVEKPAPAAPKVERKVEKPAPAAPEVELKLEEPTPATPEVELKLEEPTPAAPEVELKLEEPAPAAPEVELKLELETESEPAAAPSNDTAPDDDTPDWDRDPTLAELRPDLDALERAMAVAHGRDPETGEESAPAAGTLNQQKPKEEIEEIPEITLDDSINRKVDREALERKKRLEEEGIIEEEQEHAVTAETTEADKAREEKAAAELEKIAVGLSKAKTIEDVDDKMAETLFGEELSVAAAAVAARVAEEAAAAEAEAQSSSPEPAAQADAGQSEMEKEFENVWGEKPNVEVSIESQIEDQKGGLDISASQRLATVRALNTGNTDEAPQKAAGAPPPGVSPDPIEEQITTSLTQTMKALKVNPDPAAINDDDDDDEDERKGGFFSRFRRS